MSTTSLAGVHAPRSEYDPYTDAALLDPWPGYRHLRDLGPVVWLPRYEMFAQTRHASVTRALRDWETFSSASGVMMNEDMNQVLRGNTLCSDGVDHDAVLARKVRRFELGESKRALHNILRGYERLEVTVT